MSVVFLKTFIYCTFPQITPPRIHMFSAAFCGPDRNMDDCAVEFLLLLWPYYIFLFLFLPFRVYEIRVLPASYPPKWWPMSHMIKRVLTLSQIIIASIAVIALLYIQEAHVYLILSCMVHILCWGSAYLLLGCEYKRYQPVTWIGLRGFWFLTGVEACIRVTWMVTSPIDSTPDYLVDYPAISAISIAILSLTQLAAMMIAVLIPNDLNVNLLSHIQRLLLEHPYENFASNSANVPYSSIPNVYTLHEEDNNPQTTDMYQSRRADVPGWIYSVEEELPFSPKIDIIDIHVLAVNEGRTIKTVYRIQARVTTDSIVVEFNARRRYKQLRYLDDRLRAVFDHSRFPEQRASMGSFPPRELTQADPFARQIALREYLRRLSESPVFYVQEFLDMVGIDPRFDCGRLYEECLQLQKSQLDRLPIRRQRTTIVPMKPAAGSPITNEPVPWRPPAPVLVNSTDDSGGGSQGLPTPVGPPISPSLRITVTIPDYVESSKKIVYYRIVTKTSQFGIFESRHRFSDFQRLAVHLRDFLDVRPSVDLPRLIRFSQPQSEFLQERRACLEKYLQTLVSESPGIISSRLVRSFFKLPADPLMLSAIPPQDIEDQDSEILVSSSSRLTPTATAFPTNLSEPELTTPPPSLITTKIGHPEGSPSPINRAESVSAIYITVPFFCYDLECSSDVDFVYCVRVIIGGGADDWVRFHSFEDFIKLKNSLATTYPNLVEGIPDFPPKRSIWTGAADVPGIKVECEGRKIVLTRWLGEVVKRAIHLSGGHQHIDNVQHACPTLFGFVNRIVDDESLVNP